MVPLSSPLSLTRLLLALLVWTTTAPSATTATDIFGGNETITTTTAAQHRMLICFLTRNSWAVASLYTQQMYQIEKVNQQLIAESGDNDPKIQFDTKLLYNSANQDVAPMLRTVVGNGTDCDAFFGPLASTLAVTTGPLINVPQIDFASTSPELSDKARFPFYNRVNDGQEAQTRLLARIISQHFEWDVVNVLCTEETLGRGIVETLSEAFSDTNTRIGVQRCVGSNPTADQVRSAVLAVAQESRIIVLAINHILPAWTEPEFGILAQIIELGLHKTHVLIVPPDEGCVLAPGLARALCLEGFQDVATYGPIYGDYLANNNFNQTHATLLEAGLDLETTDRIVNGPYNGTYAYYAQDAFTFFINAYLEFLEEEPDLFDPQDYVLMNSVLRNYTIDGISGRIELDQFGDRATESLYNILSLSDEPGEHTIVMDNRLNRINVLQDIVWFDSTTNVPVASIEEDDDSDEVLNRNLIIIFCAIVVVIVITFAVVLTRIAKRTRNLAYAPKIPSIALAFTDIESSTQLWRRDALAMSQSLEVHNKIIRRNIQKHGGYEVKTVGDAFMIATKTPEQMIRIAVETQRDFRDYPSWPEPEKVKIKIRFGIHVGAPEVVYDEVTKGYDYFGNDVNKAARVESKCIGQQIMITADSVTDEQIQELEKELDVVWEDGKEFELKGIDEPQKLSQITYDPALSKWDEVSDAGSSELDTFSETGRVPRRSQSIRLGHPTFLDVQSEDFYSDASPFEDMVMMMLEGFFSTALSPQDTSHRFDWLFKSLILANGGNQPTDGEKLRLLAQRLQGMVDVRGIKRACQRIAEDFAENSSNRESDRAENLAGSASSASQRHLQVSSMRHLASLRRDQAGNNSSSQGATMSSMPSLPLMQSSNDKESPLASAAMLHLSSLKDHASSGELPEEKGVTFDTPSQRKLPSAASIPEDSALRQSQMESNTSNGFLPDDSDVPLEGPKESAPPEDSTLAGPHED
mmetsp:Transcript_2337/g.4736  ORF Transcript_2337/g.4736 Transcript_2337/m.4736 type:complete len:978 (+) Transcript_2337:106-3039(+)|eukprot:CAMPEP_0168792102 /NCGR_PEP_ID=MMETSP0725-20121227/14339_1 /TAXON_ID=265536 /ORGANISM="Amphiprora sp., Strain CCMP467" /LENGTH=977 /DNA_ID=CAMNT_0008842721 /DNA_START=171 /DNA_END=3104 /DNA_ORIENTATION=+